MCFSAAASFASSAVIGGLGVGTLAKTKGHRELVFTFIPMIFATQQAIEGFLWLALEKGSPYAFLLTCLFLFFALLWWPVYVPFSAWFVETDTTRRKLLFALTICGAVVGLTLYIIFLRNPQVATIVNESIQYPLGTPYRNILALFYGFVTIGPLVVSTKPIVRIFCALLLFTAVPIAVIYYINFISVWCFFATIISTVIFLSVRRPFQL